MKDDIGAWIAEAFRALNIPSQEADGPAARAIHRKVEERFVAGNPRAWWLGFKTGPEVWPNDQAKLSQFFDPPETPGWFIPETESPSEILAYRLSPAEAERVIGECPYFEYSFVNDEATRLVAETDHNVFLVCRG